MTESRDPFERAASEAHAFLLMHQEDALARVAAALPPGTDLRARLTLVHQCGRRFWVEVDGVRSGPVYEHGMERVEGTGLVRMFVREVAVHA